MPSVVEVTKDLITELVRVQAPGVLPEKSGMMFPGQIAVGDNRFIVTSSELERLITLAAQELRQEDPALARTHTVKEWAWQVRSAFGPALMLIDLDDDREESTRTVLAAVRSRMRETSPATDEREYAFGCTLFGSADIPGFEIGPVRFEPREEWLSRKVVSKDVTKLTARRVRLIWAGKKPAKRKSTIDAMRERDVLDGVGTCPFVASVHTKGLAPEASRLKAQVAAHMAMAVIALRWNTPSRTLAGFHLLNDAGVRHQRSLVFMPGRQTLAGAHMVGLPHGPTISKADWEKQLGDNADDFAVMGEAIAYYISAGRNGPRPRMLNQLAQALLWFHEACRDEVDLMSVVKFSACLDALASGGKARGIQELIGARLRIKPDDTIRKDGPTLRTAIKEIYSDGRSRTIHGTNDELGHDWSSTRQLAEQFARLCLIQCVEWMVDNPQSDDPAALLK